MTTEPTKADAKGLPGLSRCLRLTGGDLPAAILLIRASCATPWGMAMTSQEWIAYTGLPLNQFNRGRRVLEARGLAEVVRPVAGSSITHVRALVGV